MSPRCQRHQRPAIRSGVGVDVVGLLGNLFISARASTISVMPDNLVDGKNAISRPSSDAQESIVSYGFLMVYTQRIYSAFAHATRDTYYFSTRGTVAVSGRFVDLLQIVVY